MRLSWALWLGSVAASPSLDKALPSCRGETEEERRAGNRSAAVRTAVYVPGWGGSNETSFWFARPGLDEVGTCDRSLAPGDPWPCHPSFKGLLKGQPAEFGWNNRIYGEMFRRTFLFDQLGVDNFFSLLSILEQNQVFIAASSFTVALLVHFDKDNRREMKSFFYNFLLWDLGLQLVVFLPKVTLTHVTRPLMRYVSCESPPLVDGLPQQYSRVTVRDCDAGYFALMLGNPMMWLPPWAPRWTDLVVCLDRCVTMSRPAWYRARFSDPALPARRRALPLFLAFLVYTHHLFGSVGPTIGRFRHYFVAQHYTLLPDGRVRSTMFKAKYRHCDSSAKRVLYDFFTMEFLPVGLRRGAHLFVNSYSLGLNALLWLYLGLVFFRLHRQENAESSALRGGQNRAALLMTVVVFSVDVFIHFWRVLLDATEETREALYDTARTSSDPATVDQALFSMGRLNNIEAVQLLVENFYCLNLVFLLAFSMKYRRLAGRAFGKWRLVQWAKSALANNSVKTI